MGLNPELLDRVRERKKSVLMELLDDPTSNRLSRLAEGLGIIDIFRFVPIYEDGQWVSPRPFVPADDQAVSFFLDKYWAF